MLRLVVVLIFFAGCRSWYVGSWINKEIELSAITVQSYVRSHQLVVRTVNTFVLNSFRNNSFFAKKIRKEREVKEVFTFHILNFFPYQLSSQRLITATVNHSATCESLTLHLDCD